MSIIRSKENGALFIQTDGPNTPPQFIDCVDLEDFDEAAGTISLVRCFNPFDPSGWATLGFTEEPPDLITIPITGLLSQNRSILEQIDGPSIAHILIREGGFPDQFDNWTRALILDVAKVGTVGYSGLVNRETDNLSTRSTSLLVLPPTISVFQFTEADQSTGENALAGDIAFLAQRQPWSASGGIQRGASIGLISLAGGGSGFQIALTLDGGASWTVTATAPFVAGDPGAVGIFPLGNSYRMIVANAAAGADPAEIAISDDSGATWTEITIGTGAAAGLLSAESMFVLSPENIWAVSESGDIFKSSDRGLSWVIQGAGATAQDLIAVNFFDAQLGLTGGASDTILKTQDGGQNWSLIAATGGGNGITALEIVTEFRYWAGDDSGELYFSLDGGATWTQRTYTGRAGLTGIAKIQFLNPSLGMLWWNIAGRGFVSITRDGGYTWEEVETFSASSNAGINGGRFIDPFTAYVIGEVEGTETLLRKLFAKED